MKTLVILMVLVFLPFSVSVDAGVKFETYNTVDDVWTADSVSIAGLELLVHDTLREYLHIIRDDIYRIKCGDFTERIWFDKNDIKHVEWVEQCDTFFHRLEYREIWVLKVQVWLDSLQWQQLLRILEQAE